MCGRGGLNGIHGRECTCTALLGNRRNVEALRSSPVRGTRRASSPVMDRVTRIPRASEDQSRALAEVQTIAWLLDNSIPVPGTGGRRFGIDAVIGFVPVVGDLISGGIGLFVVWRGSRLGLPRVVVARMLANTAIDMAIGAIPVLGDAFDLWFKANTRNLGLMRRHLEQPDLSTRSDWVVLLGLVGAVVLVVVLLGWFVVAVISEIVGAF
jgi:hypothetical protein